MKVKNRQRSQFDLNDDLEKIKAILSDTAYDVKGRAGEVLAQSLDNARERTRMLKDNVEGYTSEKPLKSLGISFLAGIVLGYLFKH